MAQNILITGAAGFIGGTILADFVSRTNGPIKKANIKAAVRTEEQAKKLAALGIVVVPVDLGDAAAVRKAILENEIDGIIHAASSMDAVMASQLIEALGQRRKISGKDVFFIHSSVTSLFAKENGWPFGELKDTDPTILEKQKELQKQSSNPVTATDIMVVEQSKALGVTSVIVLVPLVYGTGSGEWKRLSTAIPTNVRSSMEHKVVYKFDTEGRPAAAHVSDMAALYALITEKLIQHEPIPTGESGYYFAMAHETRWWEVADTLATKLYARGLVSNPEPQFWPSDEMAGASLGWPLQYVRPMATASGGLAAVNAYQIGWQPKWNQQRFLSSMDDEIQAVLDLDRYKSSIYDALKPSN